MNLLRHPFITLFLLWPVLTFGQKNQAQKPLSNAAIQFEERQFDFGDVNQGETVSHKFQFTNTGTEPLILLDVQTTCGCTAPVWPKNPIPPGESSELVVNFNTSKKVGRQNKIITIYTNGQKPEEKLKIIANILPAGDTQNNNKTIENR